MGGRTVPFCEDDICDMCGAKGAFDFMGDCYCPKCCEKLFKDQDEEQPSAAGDEG